MLLRPFDGSRTGPEPDRDDNPRDDEPSRWSKSGTVCAIALVTMLVVSGAIIGWSRLSSDSPARAQRGPTGPVPASGTVPTPVRPGATASSSPTPTRVLWLQVGLGALPFSATAGPATIHAGVPAGFAHTQAGSVEAAIQILGRLSWSAQTATSMQAVVTASTTPAAQAHVVVGYGPPTDPSVIPQVAGFQIITYGADQAVVNLALRFNGALRVSPATMQWSDVVGGAADWRLAGAPGPLSQTSWAAVEDLTGYILFSGQPAKAGD